MNTGLPPEPVTGSMSALRPGPGASCPSRRALSGAYVRSQKKRIAAARARTRIGAARDEAGEAQRMTPRDGLRVHGRILHLS